MDIIGQKNFENCLERTFDHTVAQIGHVNCVIATLSTLQTQVNAIPTPILITAKVSLTAAQIKTLNSIPVQIAAAPGVGYAIQVLGSSVKFIDNGTPFTSSHLRVKTDTATNVQFQRLGILDGGTSKFSLLVPIVGDSLVENKALMVDSNADSAVGDGTAIVYVSYYVITL